jgi:hypothetical protein
MSNELNEAVMKDTNNQAIVPGIFVTSSGQATVAPSQMDVLVDLAIRIEESTVHPVDVEHILAAIVLAARNGEIGSTTPLSSNDPALVDVLVKYVKVVFEQFGGKVGRDD